MYHIIAILAAAFGFLTGAHAVQPQGAVPPFGMVSTNQTNTPITRRPMDAILPFPSVH